MYRRWRVRHSYPKPVVDLVVRLIPVHGAATLSRRLDIPSSVIYRWRAKSRDRMTAPGSSGGDAEALATLVARCEELGFSFPGYSRAANISDRHSIDAVQREATAHASIADAIDGKAVVAPVLPSRICADGPEGQGRSPVKADTAEPPCALQEGARATGQRYVFDACKERPERGVRSRMEAVRQAVDTRYFLDVDCRTLAESARMSLHHFMRVFRDMFGMSPHQYLARARVEAAKRLLLASSEPIEVIAVGVGFRSGPCLNRAFKRIEGMSASTYCRMAKKGSVGRMQRTPMAAVTADGPRQALE